MEGEKSKVYRLKNALYGLKQAPRAWNACIDGYLHPEWLHQMSI
jgi:hypothetical protein